MPVVYMFPTTIYSNPVVSAPLWNDELECSIDQPTSPTAAQPAPGELPLHPNTWRATLKLKVSSVTANGVAGLTNGKVSITVPRSAPALIPPPNPASPIFAGTTVAPTGINFAANGSFTATWDFATLQSGTYLFYVDFTPPTQGPSLTASFDVSSPQLSVNAHQTETFLPH